MTHANTLVRRWSVLGVTSHCLPHVPIAHTYEDQGTRRDPQTPSVLCGKCWQRVSPFFDVVTSTDAAAIRRSRKRKARRGRR